jgi:hypothetical protein
LCHETHKSEHLLWTGLKPLLYRHVDIQKVDFAGSGYQCDGDADGATEGVFKYRVYSKDLNWVVANWKKKIDDPTLNPCADIDHKAVGVFKYRVYTKDLSIIVANWKKTDAALAGDCPRPE